MKFKLEDICSYYKKKVEVSNLTLETYVSTENMLPNKIGVVNASSLPSTKSTQAFEEGDILVSNIRPYFKKIWKAKFNGGCSNDVLVFKANENIDSDFLYYVLADHAFFTYAMASSKGTKMPRGDKTSIMQYDVPDYDVSIQKKIARILKRIDDKIELNNKINNNLEEQAMAIFNNIFPNTFTNDKFIGDFITPKRGKSLLSKNAVSGDVPVVAGGLKPSTYHNVANTVAPVITISASGANAGYVGLWDVPVWSSDSSFIDSSMTENVYFWYAMLRSRQQEIFDAQTGSAQPHIYPQHIAAMSVYDLNNKDIQYYNSTVTPIFETIGHNDIESKILSELRDTLLPKLMSGEIDVSKITI